MSIHELAMLSRPKFSWTLVRHCLPEPAWARNKCGCGPTLPFFMNPLTQSNACRRYSSQSTTAPQVPEGALSTKKGSKARRATSTRALPQAPQEPEKDLAIEIMHRHKDAMRRLKTRHLPSMAAPSTKPSGPKKHESKSGTPASERKGRQSPRKYERTMPVVADNTQYPNHAREYSPTEKIESIDTMSFQRLFQKREGIFFHVSGSVFTIKATRREFTPPEPVRIPPFVRTAIEGYEHQYSQYNQALQQYIQQDRSESALDSGAGTASPCFDPTTTINSNLHHIPEPKPPIIPFTVQQFLHKPLRHPPETRESIHAPYRVSVASPKKTISKLAVYRTLCRRKFYQAVENVFRGRAQPGFDYLIFAGKDSLKTPQSRLEQLLINALEDQRLHASRVWPVSSHSQDMRKKGNTRNNAASAAEKVTLAVHDVVDHPSSLAQPTDGTKAAAHVSHASHAKQRKDDDDIHMQDNPKDGPSHKSIRLRYRNDQKPPFQKFWKHALPNPLPRKTFRESYLDLYADKGEPGSPEHQRAVILRQRQGMWLHRRRLLNNENQLKAVEAAKERQKVLAQYRNYVESLIEKHFAERS